MKHITTIKFGISEYIQFE